MRLTGNDVSIQASQEKSVSTSKAEQKQSGLTVALSGSAGGAMNAAVQSARDAKESQDSRLAGLQATKAALSAGQAVQEVRLAQATENYDGLVGVNISYGQQQAKSASRHEQLSPQGSGIYAGQDLHIMATGAASQQGDIQVQGSELSAGQDIVLEAKRDITLQSVENRETYQSENHSKGGSVGVGLTFGKSGTGVQLSANVNKGKGHEIEEVITHTNSIVKSGQEAKLISGQDVTLQGTKVMAERVTIDAGNNLVLRSEQDSETYFSQQDNMSAGINFNVGTMSGSGNLNVNKGKIESQYTSVTEQTGVFAGQEGYTIHVGQHTQLDGAVIGSKASADKNRLDTGTLGFSNIENHAEYQVEQQNISVGSSGGAVQQIGQNLAVNSLLGDNQSDSVESTTYAAVSAGTITIRDEEKQAQDLSSLSRDVDHAENRLNSIFDKESIQRQQQQAILLAEIGNQVSELVKTEGKIAQEKALRDPDVRVVKDLTIHADL